MGRIVLFGDAIASGIAHANQGTLDAGRVGCGLVSGSRLSLAMIERGDRIVVSIGWSDVNAVFGAQPFFSPAMYEQRLVALLKEMRNRNAGAPILLLGLEPLTARYPGISNSYVMPLNLLLEQIARRAEVGFLDLAAQPVGNRKADGLHYRVPGYQLLFVRIQQAMMVDNPIPRLSTERFDLHKT